MHPGRVVGQTVDALEAGADADVGSLTAYSVLLKAAWEGQCPALEMLVPYNADVHAASHGSGPTFSLISCREFCH